MSSYLGYDKSVENFYNVVRTQCRICNLYSVYMGLTCNLCRQGKWLGPYTCLNNFHQTKNISCEEYIFLAFRKIAGKCCMIITCSNRFA